MTLSAVLDTRLKLWYTVCHALKYLRSFCAGPGFRYIQILPKTGVPAYSNADYVLTVQCGSCKNCNISCVTGDQNKKQANVLHRLCEM